MESASDTASLEELAMGLLEELASALEECTTATPDTTEPPSSTLLSLVRMLVANASFCKRDISILSIEMNICHAKKFIFFIKTQRLTRTLFLATNNANGVMRSQYNQA